jgi:uncharacterized DUF497 family protein
LAELRKKEVNLYAVKGAWTLNGSIESKVFLTMIYLRLNKTTGNP